MRRIVDATPENRVLGRTTALIGERGGKYPHGSSLLVRGTEETAIIDPSLSLHGRANRPAADRVILSHCHEDHIAGLALYPQARVDVHEADVVGLRSIDDMMAIYGYAEPIGSSFQEAVLRDFYYAPRPDAVAFADGAVFDLGGGVRVSVVHTPGHTRGHSCLFVEPDGVLYLGDIELSSFGPYYGDAWSDLEDFERSLALVRDIDARWYATFHHIGVLEGRAAYLERLERFTAVIADRERRLLEYLGEPRTIDDVVAHRFVYRPQDPVSFADPVERRSMSQHIARLAANGRVREVDAGRWVRVH
jgi:glyoxylase-like metal-dependent hydrolase (beta-lactamase superfamily II)